MKIIHAVCDENGQGRGGLPGDQTGKEIREASWYPRDGGWQQVIVPLDPYLAGHAVTIARSICDGNYGYNKDERWTGYDSICASSIETGCGDFDCSSLVLSCYRLAGLAIKEKTGRTRDLAKILTNTGRFTLITEGEILSDPATAKKGTLYCSPGKHVVICIEDGPDAEKPSGSADRVRAKGSVRIRETPKTGATIAIAHKGDVIEVYGQDEETGWYHCATGYVTNNERYVERL